MLEAIRLSRVHMKRGDGGPFGAVVVVNHRIVGRGWNQVTSSMDPTAHAEIVAIRAAAQALKTFELQQAVLYSSCEPCPMCLSAIYWARIQKVYFANTRSDAAEIGFDDDLIYREFKKPPSRRLVKMIPLLRSKALKVFAEWSSDPTKILY